MLYRSFQLFFLSPLKDIVDILKSYIIFIYNFFIETLTSKNIRKKSEEELANEAFKIFKFIIFFILTNIGVNEAFLDINSDLLEEIKSEVVYLLFFYITFILCYYIFYLYGKLVKNSIHTIILSSNWLLVMVATTIVFQLTGILNPDRIPKTVLSDLMNKDVLWTILVYFVVLIIQIYRLYKSQIIRWFDILFYILSWFIFSFFLIIKGVIIQDLIS